ncbi:hypothetical protein [Kineococcus arenarius]|uniref:hypothetical protein n=1 Tax=Kineococcus sp. SYSU DK007 TaxID=3383128 RepID=UPI003D7E3C97
MQGPLLTLHTTSTTSATASVHGELGHRHGCLSIGEYPAIWPHGTTWDEASRTLTLPDGTRAPIGTPLDGSGGYVSVEHILTRNAHEPRGHQAGAQELAAFLTGHLDPTTQVVTLGSISIHSAHSNQPRHQHSRLQGPTAS